MPENMMSTLTSSGADSMHTSIHIIFLHISCIMAISAYLAFSRLENYARVVAFEPVLQKASFHGVTDFFPDSTTAKLLPLYTYINKFLSEPQNLATAMSSHCQPHICCSAQDSCRVATPIGTSNCSDR